MALPRSVQDIVVNSGDSVSGTFSVAGARAIGISLPAITSCQVFLQGGITEAGVTSFKGRLWDTDGANEFTWDAGVGSASMVVHDVVWPFTEARVEFGVSQAAANVSSIAVVTALNR